MNPVLEFLKDLYDFELERKDKLSAAFAQSVSLLVIVGGAYVYLISHFSCTHRLLTALFVMISSVVFIVLLRSLLSLIRTLFGFEYAFLPAASEILDHKKELDQYRAKYGDSVPSAEHLFEEKLTQLLVDAASQNQNSNFTKSQLISKANRNLGYATILCVAAAAVYFPAYYLDHERGIQNVRIVKTSGDPNHVPRTKTASESKTTTPTSAAPPTTACGS